MTINVIRDHDTNEYIALADGYPSLSWIADTHAAAIEGMHTLLNDINDEES